MLEESSLWLATVLNQNGPGDRIFCYIHLKNSHIKLPKLSLDL